MGPTAILEAVCTAEIAGQTGSVRDMVEAAEGRKASGGAIVLGRFEQVLGRVPAAALILLVPACRVQLPALGGQLEALQVSALSQLEIDVLLHTVSREIE